MPVTCAFSIAIDAARLITRWPMPLSPLMSAVEGNSRTTRMLGRTLKPPALMRRAYCGRRLTPCPSEPCKSACAISAATVTASSSGRPSRTIASWMKAFKRSKLTPTLLAGPECLERDDGERILDARNDLHLLVHEMTDVGFVIDIEFHQEVIVPRGRIDLGGDLGFGQLVGDRIGLAELAFDLDEERNHRGGLRGSYSMTRKSGTGFPKRSCLHWSLQIGQFWGA